MKAQDARDISSEAKSNRDRPDMFNCCTTQGAKAHITREAEKGKLITLVAGLSDREETRQASIRNGFHCRNIDGGKFEVLEVRWLRHKGVGALSKTPTWEVPLPDWMRIVVHIKWARSGSFHVVQHNGDKTHLWLHFGPEERGDRRGYMLVLGPMLIVWATLWGAGNTNN